MGQGDPRDIQTNSEAYMAKIENVYNKVCAKLPDGAKPDPTNKAICEEHVRDVYSECRGTFVSESNAKKCVEGKLPGAARWTAKTPPPPVTADDVIKMIERGGTPSPADLAKIDETYIKGVIASGNKPKLDAIELQAKAYPAIATALAAAKANGNGGSTGDEEGAVLEYSAIIPPALKFKADGFGSSYDTAGLTRPFAVASGGQGSEGAFNGVAHRLSLLDRHKFSKGFALSYGARLDYAHYTVKDSNPILNEENKFNLHQFTGSAVLRGAFTLHDYFAIYGEVAPGLRVSTGSGRIATGAPAGDKDENAFTADKVPTQLVGEASIGVQIGPRDSVHVNAHVGIAGTIHDFTPQNVSVEGAASPTPVERDGGILTGGLTLVMPFQAIGRFFKRIFN